MQLEDIPDWLYAGACCVVLRDGSAARDPEPRFRIARLLDGDDLAERPPARKAKAFSAAGPRVGARCFLNTRGPALLHTVSKPSVMSHENDAEGKILLVCRKKKREEYQSCLEEVGSSTKPMI